MNEQNTEIRFVGSREVRVIPKGWAHPKDARGRYIPLLPEGYAFEEGQDAAAPTMPPTLNLRAAETEIVAYETVSEGTPISPAFPNSDAGRIRLVSHCAEHATTYGSHKASGEAWAAILFGEASIDIDGTVRA